ncbi:hypothetical protein AGLY_013301, partial [Aphis glycines]
RLKKNISQTVQTNALSLFIEDVSFSIRTILKSRNIGTLERAITLAIIEEEKIVKTIKKNNNKSYIKHDRCGKVGHYANECRSTILSNNNIQVFKIPAILFRKTGIPRTVRILSVLQKQKTIIILKIIGNVYLTKKNKTNKFIDSNNVNNEPIVLTSYANRIIDEINQNQIREVTIDPIHETKIKKNLINISEEPFVIDELSFNLIVKPFLRRPLRTKYKPIGLKLKKN